MNVALPPRPTGVPLVSAPVRVAFDGGPGAFFRLLVRGALLTLPTFGFYRFWLLTQIRRHLWANTRLNEDAFEYTGTARELLIGFLIALAVLVPLYVTFFVLGLVAERLQAFASIPLTLLLYGFGQYAIYRARRYRATRTVFRGLRFWMAGSGLTYAGKAALWDLLTVVTLGLAYPWRVAALERYKIGHTFYGTLQGRFDGRGWDFFKRGVLLWAVVVGLPIALLAAVIAWANGGAGPWQSVLVLFAVVLPFVYPVMRAIEMRWFLQGLRFGEVSLDSDLGRGRLIAPYVKFILATTAFGLVGSLVLGGLFFAFRAELRALEQGDVGAAAIIPLVLMALAYISILLGVGVLKRHFLDRGIWAAVVPSIHVTNPGAIDKAVAAGSPASGVGEGLADALDVGAI